ncbi:hypothetical protein JCM8547_007883 [Rhodosporidiobolus lusitaniae]
MNTVPLLPTLLDSLPPQLIAAELNGDFRQVPSLLFEFLHQRTRLPLKHFTWTSKIDNCRRHLVWAKWKEEITGIEFWTPTEFWAEPFEALLPCGSYAAM